MINNRVKITRRRLELTQEELALRAHIGRSTVTEIETGKTIPNIETALKLAKAMNIRVDKLFYLDEDI